MYVTSGSVSPLRTVVAAKNSDDFSGNLSIEIANIVPVVATGHPAAIVTTIFTIAGALKTLKAAKVTAGTMIS